MAIIFTPENTDSSEIVDKISENDVAINKTGNKILKIFCDVIVNFPIVISTTNSPLMI